jgi:hypothetical protein
MTIKHLFYHLLHFIGIGKFFIAEIRIPNFRDYTTMIHTLKGYTCHKDVEYYLKKVIVNQYGHIGLCLITIIVKKVW